MSESTENNSNNQPLKSKSDTIDGLLHKYTNVVKGWQYRWFVLTPSRCTLEYYMPDERKKVHPRGCIYLAGSVIAPSDEDSQTFTVSAASGETYKLKASDANERQRWVNRLRQVALAHETTLEQLSISGARSQEETKSSLNAVTDTLMQAQKTQRTLVSAIEAYTCTDQHLLTLKSLSSSTVMSLEQCFVILHSIEGRRLSSK
ncbi:oxysterol-binding protein-related protein 11 [Tetranychus urticae]|uniref:PH domain-containing protein n=1 Tax=Tetranychus urticae TaxID=32264 RepID=T1KMJ6_TETUR|nr:oxysterol-binding protein-related protein 11 [Tetranychus urticae]